MPECRLISLRTVFSSLVLLLLAGIAILSPTYFAFFYEGAGIQQRAGGVSLEAALVNSLHPGALATFASPYFTLLKAYNPGQLWPYTDISMTSIYAGALTSTLALLALLKHPRSKWRWWLAAVGLLSLGCALGQALPLRAWLYELFYPMRFFRHPSLFRGYYLFATSVLALIATRDMAQALRNSSDRIWKYFCFAACGVSLSAMLVFITLINSGINAGVEAVETLNSGLNAGDVSLLLGKLHLLVWIGVSVAAIAFWLMAGRWRRWSVPLLLLTLAAGDVFLTNAISQPAMMISLPEYVSRRKELDNRHSTSLDLTANGLRRDESACDPNPPCQNFNNDQLITKVPVLHSYYYAAEGVDFFHETVERPLLKRLAIGADRIWFTPRVEQVSPTVNNFAAYSQRAETLGAAPLVIHTPQEMLQQKPQVKSDESAIEQTREISNLPAVENINVELIKYLPDELSFNVQCPTDGWLLVTDRWARSWRAEINDKIVSIYGGNFIFRAVPVQAGFNKVRFTYDPPGFPLLIFISWGTLAIVLMISIYSHVRSARLFSRRPADLPSGFEEKEESKIGMAGER